MAVKTEYRYFVEIERLMGKDDEPRWSLGSIPTPDKPGAEAALAEIRRNPSLMAHTTGNIRLVEEQVIITTKVIG